MTVCRRRPASPSPSRGRRGLAALGVSVALLGGCSSSPSEVEVRPATPTTATGGDDEASDTVDSAPTETNGETATSVETTAEPTPSTDPATVAAPAYDFGEIDPIVQAAVEANGLGGAGLLVVDREGGVVHEQYWGEFGPDRVSLVASSSKMIVAGVLLALADDGLLDLDAPVADVAPWGSGNPTITPAQLVSNSSGLVGLGPNPAYPPYVCQFLPAGTLQDCAASIFTTTADDADVIAPDTEFRYGGAQWQVAGAVAEVASGRTWAELIEQTYVEPCGVDSLGFANHWTEFGLGFDYPAAFAGDPSNVSATDNPNIEGGAYITAPDYAQLLLMLLRNGRCGDEQVLSSESIERMLADRIGEVYGGSDGDRGYGMGWFVDRTNGIRTDPGAYGSVAWIDADAGYGAYLVIEGAGRVGNALAGELFGPVAAAIAAS